MDEHDTKETHWNYRLVKKGNLYAFHEVHYENAKPVLVTENPVPVEAGSKEDAKWVLRMMQANWCMPAIDYETLEEIDE